MVKRSSHRRKETSLRHVWLATLGTVVVARRELPAAATKLAEELGRAGLRTAQVAGDVRDIARGSAISLRERIEPRVRAFGAEVEARLQPMLVKLGAVPRTARKASRRPALRKATTARTRKARA